MIISIKSLTTRIYQRSYNLNIHCQLKQFVFVMIVQGPKIFKSSKRPVYERGSTHTEARTRLGEITIYIAYDCIPVLVISLTTHCNKLLRPDEITDILLVPTIFSTLSLTKKRVSAVFHMPFGFSLDQSKILPCDRGSSLLLSLKKVLRKVLIIYQTAI